MKLTKEQQAVVKYVVNITKADGELLDQIFIVETEEDTIHFDNLNCHSLEWMRGSRVSFDDGVGFDVGLTIRADLRDPDAQPLGKDEVRR